MMINWILGGLIGAFTLYIVVRSINRARKGKSMCGCDGCGESCSGCSSRERN